MTDLVKIKFLESATVKTGTGADEIFEAGKSYDMNPRSADRWVKRGKAQFASDADRAKAEGASSDVSLKIQDRDRIDANPSRGTPADQVKPHQDPAKGNDGVELNYKKLNVEELKAEAAKRGLEVSSSDKKNDLVELLERNDKITEAIAAKDYDVLHVDELKDLAAQENIDISGKDSKADIISAIKAAHGA